MIQSISLDISTWHPLTVHFPIAFLSLSSVIGIFLIIKPKKALSTFNLGLLILGCVGLLISIYTGNKEEGQVARVICDPTELKTHQNFAYYTLYLYLGCLASSILVFKLNQGLIKLVRGIRELNNALGDGVKVVTETEKPIRDKLRK